MEIKNIGVHHFGGPSMTLKQLSETHRLRWPDFPSKLRPDLFVGYNFVIWRDGSWTQARYIGEETAAQQGHNLDTISICMEGDFTYSKPGFAQQETLKRFIQAIVAGKLDPQWKILPETKVSVSYMNVLPHRVLQPHHTECYGRNLSDDWARMLAFPPVTPVPDPLPVKPPTEGPEITKLQKILELLKQVFGLQLLINKMKLGSVKKQCWDDVRG